jgi:S-adenosylmethionine-diacylglycerol 3-amino-3-carboxypropyl transferase
MPTDTVDTPAEAADTGLEQDAAADASELRSEVATRADFSAIRYSQSWEDPTCLERALDIQPEDVVLSIAAAGDNSFALLLMGDEGPAKVVSVDLNPAQVALVELKRAAILTLEHEELLRFLGVHPCMVRAQIYAKVRVEMPDAARTYWDYHPELIDRGVLHVGKLEGFFRTFRRYVLPLTHSRKLVKDTLLTPRADAERAIHFDERWSNARWNAMIKLFFSQAVIGRFGRDPAFFEHVNMPSVSAHYAGRARHAMAVQPCHDNWFLQYILLGAYPDPNAAHPYLAAKNLPVLRERMDRLEIHCTELEQFLGEHEPGSFTKFNLSDIFEWMSDDLYEQMLRALVRTSRPGGRLAYWNNLVLRSRPESMADVLRPDRELARRIHHDDRAFLYRDFQVEIVTDAVASPEGAA